MMPTISAVLRAARWVAASGPRSESTQGDQLLLVPHLVPSNSAAPCRILSCNPTPTAPCAPADPCSAPNSMSSYAASCCCTRRMKAPPSSTPSTVSAPPYGWPATQRQWRAGGAKLADWTRLARRLTGGAQPHTACSHCLLSRTGWWREYRTTGRAAHRHALGQRRPPA